MSAFIFSVCLILSAVVPDFSDSVGALGSEKFSERAAAADKLEAAGETARPALTAALASHDPEVRYGASRILCTLSQKRLWSPTMVTFHGSGRAGAVAKSVAALADMDLQIKDGKWCDKLVSVEATNAPIMQVLDKVASDSGGMFCDVSGLGLNSLGMCQSDQPHRKVAYNGPFVAELLNADRSGLTFRVMSEPRATIIGAEDDPFIVAMTDADGEAIRWKSDSLSWQSRLRVMNQHSLSSGVHAYGCNTIERIGPGTGHIAKLTVAIPLICIGDWANIEFETSNSVVHSPFDVELAFGTVGQKMPIANWPPAIRDFVLGHSREMLTTAFRIPNNEIFPDCPMMRDVCYFGTVTDAEGRFYTPAARDVTMSSADVTIMTSYWPPSPGSSPHSVFLSYPRAGGGRMVLFTFSDVDIAPSDDATDSSPVYDYPGGG